MKIAIDVSPLQSGHKVRGVGFYLEYLKRSLLKYYPENEYIFFTKGEKLNDAVDIVHYPYFEPFFLTLPFFKKHKRVVTVHDLTPLLYPQHFPPGLKGQFRWQIQKYNLCNSDAIITDSNNSQIDISRILHINKNKISVAYLAAAEEFQKLENGKWRQAIITKYNLPEKFVLYVGDVTWNKNLPTLIEAMKEINLTLVLVGKAIAQANIDHSNPWNKDLIIINQLMKKDKRFIKLGFVPTVDLVSIYNLATVFVFPSIYEGFGLPVLEAMQSGCPVVLSKESSLTEIGGNAAHYINPYNMHSIANGIGEVFYTPKLQKKLAEKGIKQAARFSWQKTADNTMKVYKKILHA